MKIKNILLPIVMTATASVASAQDAATRPAGIFVEPGITYQSTKTEVDYPLGFSDSTGSMDGFGLVGRAGMHVHESIFIAADARYGRLTFKDSAFNMESSADAFQLAPVVGIQMPNMGVRVWGGYALLAQADPQESQGIDVKLEEGKGFLIGAGLRVSSVSLNVEYQQLKYDKVNLQNAGPLSGATDNIQTKHNAIIGSVTFPLEL